MIDCPMVELCQDHQDIDRGEAARMLHLKLKDGCFCKENEQSVTWLTATVKEITEKHGKVVGLQQLETGSEPRPPHLRSDHDVKEESTMINCSVIDRICQLYVAHRKSGQTCSGLVKLMEVIDNLRRSIKGTMVKIMQCPRKHSSFAAAKCLVSVFVSLVVFHDSHMFPHDMMVDLLHSESSFEKLHQTLPFFEHLYLRVSRLAVEENGASLHRGSECISIDSSLDFPESLDKWVICSFLDEQLPQLLARSLQHCSKGYDALHCSLRILVMLVEEHQSARNVLSEKPKVLFTLLTESMPCLVWQRTCTALTLILNYKSTAAVGQTVSREQIIIACQVLQLTTSDVWLKRFATKDAGGFAGAMDDADNSIIESPILLALASLTIVSACQLEPISRPRASSMVFARSLKSINSFIVCKEQQESENKMISSCGTSLLTIFEDQDDTLIEVLLYTLQIFKLIEKLRFKPDNHEVRLYFMQPHAFFYHFLSSIHGDHNVLLDFLISNETCFLLYFLKYLKFIVEDINKFIRSHQLIAHWERTGSHHQLPRRQIIGDVDASSSQRATMCPHCKTDGVSRKRKFVHFEKSPGGMHPVCPACKIEKNETRLRELLDGLADYPGDPGDFAAKLADADGGVPAVSSRVAPADEVTPSSSSPGLGHDSSDSSRTLKVVLATLVKLNSSIRRQLAKDLFPYNAAPLLRLLTNILNDDRLK